MNIVAYCSNWHLGYSSAFNDILIEPLRSCANIIVKSWDTESGRDLPDSAGSPDEISVFCQFLPPKEILTKPQGHVVWVPMYDNVAQRDQQWWNALPPSLRVLSYCKAVAAKSKSAGLRTFEVQYFCNPAGMAPVRWEQKPVVMYWNRTNLVSAYFLKKLCSCLDASKIIFRPYMDWHLGHDAWYFLPYKLGSTEVKDISGWLPQSDFSDHTKEANVMIAPRRTEGVGLFFLEAMARGCAVFAYDGPTMNEYIENGVNGYLFKSPAAETKPGVIKQALFFLERRLRRFLLPNVSLFDARYYYLRMRDQSWNEIKHLDLRKCGDEARQCCQAGYERWVQVIPEMHRFIVERT
ncbi:MAG: glycosyltransferase [Candidatus Sumerlaeota bacterium]|nr:glycosyltransferase [Candidatus Sumerlaeota bacterium]